MVRAYNPILTIKVPTGTYEARVSMSVRVYVCGGGGGGGGEEGGGGLRRRGEEKGLLYGN